MEDNSTLQCDRERDFLTVTVGNTAYTVEHIYSGDRSIREIMSDFLEREVRNLDN